MLTILVLVLVQKDSIVNVNGVKVNTDIGKLIGTFRFTTSKNTKYDVFEGIPYAEPPVGKLRFQPPIAKSRLNTSIVSLESAHPCIQLDIDHMFKFQGSEDCLYLNVYTTALRKSSKLPVVVWIHGGFFFGGDTSYDRYNFDYFLDNDIVSVSITYRLGFLGFYHNDNDVAGNMGIKDQLLALRWIKKNIANFGGDPQRITLMGESAGAACVSYLVQCPLARGLFQRAIMQSGNSLSGWAVARNPQKITKFALGFFKILVSGLDRASRGLSWFPKHILPTLKMFYDVAFDPLQGLLYAPVIEKPSPTAVFTEESRVVLSNCERGDFAPIIIGHNMNEGGALTQYNFVTKILTNIYNIIYHLNSAGLLRSYIKEWRHCSSLKTDILNFYKLHSPSDMAKFLSDVFFVLPTIEYTKLFSKCNDVYLYRFSYNGAVHGDELRFLFANGDLNTNDEKRVSDNLVSLWTNFIRFGNPTPDQSEFGVMWKKNDGKNNYTYLDIATNVELKYLSRSPHKRAVDFWTRILKKCNTE